MDFTTELNPTPVSEQQRAEILSNPGFGNYFTDHMVLIDWSQKDGWQNARVVPYGPLALDPATAVLHYAQEIFEGLKAYAHADESIWLFRPEANAERFQRSAKRIALPELPVEVFIDSIRHLVKVDRAWVPSGGEMSLYLRPFMFASEKFLGVRAAQQVTYALIASPAGAYFAGGLKPVSIWVAQDFTRAAAGGTGAAKFGGNYAAGLLPQQQAAANGCDQVVFLDAAEGKWIEELGGMNLFFVMADGTLVTPELSGTILEGITRESIQAFARERGMQVQERKISIDEWRTGVADGSISEVFACGTAAVVTPVGKLKWADGEVAFGSAEAGQVTTEIRSSLVDIQYGRAADPHGWMTKIS